MSIKPETTLAQQKLVNGVTIVSTKLNNRVNALTVAWVSRVSYAPPLLMVSIGKTHHSHDMIKESGVFAVKVNAVSHNHSIVMPERTFSL